MHMSIFIVRTVMVMLGDVSVTVSGPPQLLYTKKVFPTACGVVESENDDMLVHDVAMTRWPP